MNSVASPMSLLREILGSYSSWVAKTYFVGAGLSLVFLAIPELTRILLILPSALYAVVLLVVVALALSGLWLVISELIVRGLNFWAKKRGLIDG